MRSPGLSILALACLAAGTGHAAVIGEPAWGRLLQPGPIGPVAHPAGVHPMFAHWTCHERQPLVFELHLRAGAPCQIFVGLVEDFWAEPGHRVVDLEVAGRVMATADTFKGAKGSPHGLVVPGRADGRGELPVRLLAHPGAGDPNPAVCGLLVFPAAPALEPDAIVHGRHPVPLLEISAAHPDSRTWSGRGRFFTVPPGRPTTLPSFAAARERLPSPVFDEEPARVALYWKAWELAFRNFYLPTPGSGFVSPFIDAAFNQNIFLWDTCFMTMFCNYGHPVVPGICSLDNFYARQLDDGEICREIDRTSGREYYEWVNREGTSLASRWGTLAGGKRPYTVRYVGRGAPQPPPRLMLDALNHPIPAWAEMESYRLTGDRERLRAVYPPLAAYHAAIRKYLRQGNGLYVTDWASMDNSARNRYLGGGGTAVDTSAQMVLSARSLADMADRVDKGKEAEAFRSEAAELARRINERMWNANRRFYFDLTVDGQQSPVKTIAAFWTLLAGVAGPEQVESLMAQLHDPRTFGRRHRVPTLAADEPGYDPNGGYWNGSVWAPTDAMIIRGLERCGRTEPAREIALDHLHAVTEVYKRTGTVWENYAPDGFKPGTPARGDFVGWSGLGPITWFIEYGLGIRVDAPANSVTWDIGSRRRLGIERLWFGGRTVSLLCEPPGSDGRRLVQAESNLPCRLILRYAGQIREYDLSAGRPLRVTLP